MLDINQVVQEMIAPQKPVKHQMETNVNPTPESTQSAIIVAMRDLQNNAEDTVWITKFETVFERLVTLFFLSGGRRETLAGIWPEYFKE